MRLIKEKKIVDENAKVDLFSVLCSSCFYIGFIPKASGTFGSMFALLFFLINGFEKPEILLGAVVVGFIVGIVTSKIMMKKYGDDPSVVVIDEVIGMWITILVFTILSESEISQFYLIVSFFSFRLFDIIKIQPAKYFDHLDTAFGVIMDDVIAGIYAGIVVYLITLTKFNPVIF